VNDLSTVKNSDIGNMISSEPMNFYYGGPTYTKRPVYTLLVFLFILLPQSVQAQDGQAYFEARTGFSTGDFGTQTTSDLYYLAPTLGYISSEYDASLTVPYLSLTNGTGSQSNTESGIGDMILRGGLVLMPENRNGLSLNGGLSIKLPTANETKGLGTGEMDYGAFLGMDQRIETIKLHFTAGYVKIGDPSFYDYNDIYVYGLGITKMYAKTGIYASLEGRRSMISGVHNPQEFNLGFFHELIENYSLMGNTFFGMNDGGPDFGLDISFVRWL
jgi:hypothetical protein